MFSFFSFLFFFFFFWISEIQTSVCLYSYHEYIFHLKVWRNVFLLFVGELSQRGEETAQIDKVRGKVRTIYAEIFTQRD